MKQVLSISGMKCEGCATNIQKSLVSISTVDNVSVDLDEQAAYVESLKGITKSDAQEALAATNYEVTHIH